MRTIQAVIGVAIANDEITIAASDRPAVIATEQGKQAQAIDAWITDHGYSPTLIAVGTAATNMNDPATVAAALNYPTVVIPKPAMCRFVTGRETATANDWWAAAYRRAGLDLHGPAVTAWWFRQAGMQLAAPQHAVRVPKYQSDAIHGAVLATVSAHA